MQSARIAVWLALWLALPVRADVITLPAAADNTLYQESGALSNGAGSHFFAGRTKNGVLRRALLAFDVAAAIPPGSSIQSVTLTLYMSRTRTQAQTVSLHRVLAAWGEGASDAPGDEGEGTAAAPGDATWSHRFYPGQAWSAPGGEFAAAASASAAVAGADAYYAWSSAGMVADVQAWLAAPAANFGWMVIGNESATRVAKRFDSRDNPTPSRRPALQIEFTPPAATGACCAANGICSAVLAPGTSCAGSYRGTGTRCDPNPCPQPTGACCLPDAAATCVEVTQAGCTSQGGALQSASNCALASCPVVLQPFVDALPRPAAARPISGSAGGAAAYRIAMREVKQKLHRDLPPTTVWGYADGAEAATYPGPTIEARSGQPVEVTWVNDLRDAAGNLRTQHHLPVDTCMHGADDASPRTVVHLHGGHVPAAYDGHPDATFLPGEQVTYQYPNAQLPATLWYHDHALGITRLNVWMGLAGAYLIRDAAEQALNLPAGEFEVPLVIQDRSFAPDGSLRYPAAWQEHFFGDTVLVNGKVWPFLQVKRGKYRLRMVGGSNSRTWRLRLSSGASFQVIGMEGGLLPAPVPLERITLGPGERADAIVDFAAHAPGSEILLLNDAPAPFPGSPGVGVISNVLKFVVADASGHTAPLPAALRPLERLSESQASVFRDFELRKGSDACTGTAWLINGLHWDDVTEFPRLGTTEVWSFINRSGITHPMHLHLVMFQVLDRQAFEEQDGQIVTIGARVPPPPHEAGWKDTVQVGPNEIVRVIARFETYTGRFAYHCHILEHEDHEMMRQFEATTLCGDGVRGIPDEECDDGNLVAGDCCSPTCRVEPDRDGDGFCDPGDNCPYYATSNLSDVDADGRGDACECTDQNGDGRNTVSDLIAINLAIFNPALVTPLCDGNGDGLCNVADIVAANVEIFSPGNTSTCARQPVPGP